MSTTETLLHEQLHQVQDILEHQNEELCALLHSKNQELEEILGSIDQIIWYIDIKTLSLQYVNDAITPIFGFTKKEFLSDHTLWQRCIYPDDISLVRSFFETLPSGESREILFRINDTNNQTHWLKSRIYHNAKLHFFVGITSDITVSKSQNDAIEFLAYHDPLTKLPNRSKLKLQLDSQLLNYPNKEFSLIFIDLDNFKNINDTMGHEIGDKILIEVSNRLRELSGTSHFPVRFGGDEFIILFDSADTATIDAFCVQLIHAFKQQFLINDLVFFLSSSIGIATYPQDATTPEDLIKYADIAMYEAKKNGKNQFIYYHSSMQRTIHNFLHIESLIRDGLKDDLFELYFQPLMHSKDNNLQGFEALLRLPHPTEGFISPDTFIGVAEQNGDILLIGKEVLRQACDFIQKVQEIYTKPFYVAINVSAKQLHQPYFAQDLLTYLEARRIPTHLLKVELTESALMENIETASLQLKTLKAGGVNISLDDFGTGYSSFSYLARLPIGTLKIDKSFVQSVHDSQANRHIIEAISNLAHILGMNVTAEGIETDEQFGFLAQHQIDTLQGYLFSKPIKKEFIFEKLCSSSPFFDLEPAPVFSI